MANTFGNPTLDNTTREDVLAAINTRLNTGTAVANAVFRVRLGSVTLVDYPLDPTDPLTLGASDGQAVVNPVSSSVTAEAGETDIADNYQVLDRDSNVRLSGLVTATDGITEDQEVMLGTVTLTMPAVP